jgi:hypothetical protein
MSYDKIQTLFSFRLGGEIYCSIFLYPLVLCKEIITLRMLNT